MLRCRQLVIQLTDKCNATCPQCGMRVTEPFRRSTLSMDEVRRMLDHAARSGINIVSFTGGEPLLCLDDLIGLIRHAAQAGIQYIRTGTNGFIFMNSDGKGFQSRIRRLAERLAATPLGNFWISIDSAVPSVHEKMRGFPGVVAGIEKALPIFEEFGIYPTANLGINRNIAGSPNDADAQRSFRQRMEEGFREFYRLVIGMGFTIVNTCYPMSVQPDGDGENLNAVYRATSTSSIVRFSDAEKAALFKSLMEVIPEFRPQIRIFSPLSSLYSLHKACRDPAARSYPCLGGVDFFYVDARDGITYPCGYRGNEPMEKFWSLPRLDAGPEAGCYECEWECFRDPSELLGPLREARSDPAALLGRLRRDKRFFGLWMDDLRYYRACGFFNGRRPPDHARMGRFRPLFSLPS